MLSLKSRKGFLGQSENFYLKGNKRGEGTIVEGFVLFKALKEKSGLSQLAVFQYCL